MAAAGGILPSLGSSDTDIHEDAKLKTAAGNIKNRDANQALHDELQQPPSYRLSQTERNLRSNDVNEPKEEHSIRNLSSEDELSSSKSRSFTKSPTFTSRERTSCFTRTSTLSSMPSGSGEFRGVQFRLRNLIQDRDLFNTPLHKTADTFLGSSCDEDSEDDSYANDDDDDEAQHSRSHRRDRNLPHYLNDQYEEDEEEDVEDEDSSSRSRHLWDAPGGSANPTYRDCLGVNWSAMGEDRGLRRLPSNLKSSVKILGSKETRHRLHRSGSSFNCSTTASISGLSTSSSALRSSCVEDGTASSISSFGNLSSRQPRDGVSGIARVGTSDGQGLAPQQQKQSVQFRLSDGTQRRAPEDKHHSYLKSNLSARNNGGGLLSNLPRMALSASPDKFVEAKNESTGRLFRLVHTATVGRPGVLCTHTRIEVIDTSVDHAPTLFAVRHSDRNVWNRQIRVHKNILFACRLVGVEVPKDIDIPADSRKMFEQNGNISNMNNYLERILSHIKLHHIAPGVHLYWWKPIGNGLAVLQNQISGKLVLMKNTSRVIAPAVDRIVKLINCSKLKCPTFWTPDHGYPTIELVENELEETATDEVKESEIENLVTKVWGIQELVSPAETELIIKVHTTKFLRYSIGVEEGDPKTFLLQVHYNEPLSRGLNAYPVCMSQLTSPSLCLKDIRLTFLQAVWFLKKLYDLHCEAEGVYLQQQPATSHSPVLPVSSDTPSSAPRSTRLVTDSPVKQSVEMESVATKDSLPSDPQALTRLSLNGRRSSPSRLTTTARGMDEAKKTHRVPRTQNTIGDSSQPRNPQSSREDPQASNTPCSSASRLSQKPAALPPRRLVTSNNSGELPLRFSHSNKSRANNSEGRVAVCSTTLLTTRSSQAPAAALDGALTPRLPSHAGNSNPSSIRKFSTAPHQASVSKAELRHQRVGNNRLLSRADGVDKGLGANLGESESQRGTGHSTRHASPADSCTMLTPLRIPSFSATRSLVIPSDLTLPLKSSLVFDLQQSCSRKQSAAPATGDWNYKSLANATYGGATTLSVGSRVQRTPSNSHGGWPATRTPFCSTPSCSTPSCSTPSCLTPTRTPSFACSTVRRLERKRKASLTLVTSSKNCIQEESEADSST